MKLGIKVNIDKPMKQSIKEQTRFKERFLKSDIKNNFVKTSKADIIILKTDIIINILKTNILKNNMIYHFGWTFLSVEPKF